MTIKMLPMMMIKLYGTDTTQEIAKLAYDLIGADGLLEPAYESAYAHDDSPEAVVNNFLFSMGPAIAGGASNIQRNIIGERLLGLPRDLKQPQ